jgi:hemolysin III
MQNPVRGILHGSGAIVSLLGLIALLVKSNGTRMFVATGVYGIALVSMYATSALYHSVPWGPSWKARWQMLDHIFIYVLIAGTVTPLLVGSLHGGWLAVGLLGIWLQAALGLTQEVSRRRLQRAVLISQFVMGAVALIPMVLTLTGVDTSVTWLILAGGASYLVGTVLFVNNKPRIKPGVFSHHEVFHVVVILASALHFIAIWRVVTN